MRFYDEPDEGHKSRHVGLTRKLFYILQARLEFWPLQTFSLLHARWRVGEVLSSNELILPWKFAILNPGVSRP